MNERGNIVFTLVVVLLLVGTVVTIASTLVMIKGSMDRVEATTGSIYERDSVVEVIKYVLVNEVEGLVIESFDEGTELVMPEDIQNFEEKINTVVIDMGLVPVVDIDGGSKVYIADICEKLYTGDEDEQQFIGVYCNYEPFDVDIEFSVKEDEEGSVEVEGIMRLHNLYMYEEGGHVLVDATQMEIEFQ